MSYSLESEDARAIVFARSSATQTFFAVVFIIVGLGVAGISGWLIFSSTDSFVSLTGWKGTLMLVGVMFVIVGGFLSRNRKDYDLVKIIFDHEKGAVELVQNSRDSNFIPYSRIEKFDIHVVVKSHKNASQSYSYFVNFVLRDGSVWEFFYTPFEEKAEQMLRKMQQVHLQVPCTATISNEFPPVLYLEKHGNQLDFRWRNKVGTGAFIFLVMIGTIGSAFWRIMGEEFFGKGGDAVPGLVAYFIVAVFLLIVGVAIYGIIKEITTRYRLTVDASGVEYAEETPGGKVKKSRRLEMNEISAIRFDFRLSQDKSPVEIYAGGQKSPVQIIINELDVAEKLQLKYWLEDKLRR